MVKKYGGLIFIQIPFDGKSLLIFPSGLFPSSSLDVSNLEEVLTNALNNVINQKFIETSLNGSNGAKFKDGDVVKIKGFPSIYKVLASQYIVNNDNVGTIMYKVEDTQTGQIHYVPQVFLYLYNQGE